MPRFKLRAMLFWVAITAALVGWWRERTDSEQRIRLLMQRLMSAKWEMQNAQQRTEIQKNLAARTEQTADGVLSKAVFKRVNLRGAVIQGGASAYQGTIFDNSDLSDASLTGGVSAFQGASFNNAKLKNAKLGGGGASFQLSTFENADLSGATLDGNLQGASLKNAKCAGATISGSLQGANIDAAIFDGADLSAIRGNDLESCYFETPPTYDANTKFQAGFNPHDNGWKESVDAQ